MSKTRTIDSFQVKAESGKVYTIYVNQKINKINEEFGADDQESAGSKRLICGGNPVTQIDENTYKLLDGAEIIRATKVS